MGFHFVCRGSSSISSISATSISGLRAGDEEIDITFGGVEARFDDAAWLDCGKSSDWELPVAAMLWRDGEVGRSLSRRLMVTLLGVPFMECLLALSEEEEGAWPWSEGSSSAIGRNSPTSEAAEAGRSPLVDIFPYDRSPLSRRGRFLVTEESASSMELRVGALGRSGVARLGVWGTSITLLLRALIAVGR